MGNIDRREGVGRRRGTKVGSRDRGLVAERGSFEFLTDVNYEVKYGVLFWSCNQIINLITDLNKP